MKQKEGLPFVKFMMLLSSLSPLFILMAIRGVQITNEKGLLVSPKETWLIAAAFVIIPFLVLKLRIGAAKKARDTYVVNVTSASQNKEYLFAYLFTVLLPLYSVSINSKNELWAIGCAIFFVLFVLWNMNMHFINIFFAFSGYRVFTLPDNNGSILLTTRQVIPSGLKDLRVHRISNSVFIELKYYDYDNN